MRPSNQLFFIVLALAFTIASCKGSRKPFEPQPEFQAYVAHFGQLMPESASPLRIVLAFGVSDSIRQDALATNALLLFDPPVKGETVWADDRTLVFTPSDQWPVQERFVNVSLFLSRLKELPPAFHTFRFHIRLVPPALSARQPELVSNGDSLWVEGVLSLSHPANETQNEKLVTAKLDGKKLRLHLAVVARGRQIEYRSSSFAYSQKKQNFVVEWDGQSLGIKQSGRFELEIPEKSQFRLTQLEAIAQAEPLIRIRLSQPPMAGQDIKSMIQLDPDPGFNLSTDNNLLKLSLPENFSGSLRMQIAPGLRSLSGIVMDQAFDTTLSFSELLPAVRLLNASTIISGSNMMLPFQTIGLRAVDVQVVKVFGNNMLRLLQTNNLDGSYDLRLVGRVIAREQMVFAAADEASLMSWQNRAIDLSRLITKDQSSLYRVYITFRKDYAVLPCRGGTTALNNPPGALTTAELRQWGADYYYQPDYYYPDNFQWEERDNPCHESYYYNERFAGKSLFYTRLGIIAKRAQESNEFKLYVTDLLTGMPVNDATVELYDFQLQRMARAKTDADGHVVLGQQMVDAWMAVATHGNNTTYLKLDGSQMQPLGRFDVEGVKPSSGMKGFVFTERGVYRPGDTIFAGFILENNNLPKDHPIVLELSDARNRPAGRQTLSFGDSKLVRFSIPTQAEAPTGIWTAKITAGNASFSKRIRVETIVPNRLKINFTPENKRFTPEEIDLDIALTVNWLHGDPASGQRVVVEQTVSDMPLKFSGLDGFSFTNSTLEKRSAEKIQLAEGLTDASGRLEFRLKHPPSGHFRGLRGINLEVRAYEPGGAFSVATNSYLSDTYGHYIGVKAPVDDKVGYLEQNQTHQFKVLRVNSKGKAEGESVLDYEVFKINNYWWWSGDGSTRAAYVNTSDATLVDKGRLLLKEGQGSISWKPGRYDWGEYILIVGEPGGHSASVQFSVYSGGSQTDGRKPAGASQLRISTDKSSYKVGDKAILSFEAPSGGRLLLSLENGSRQIAWRWINTTKGLNRVEIPLKPEHSPNVYAHLSLLQPLGQVENDMPVRLYGIVNLMVENPQRRLLPQLEVPTTSEAGKPFTVGVSEKQGQPMSYMLAIVDEGLLDLTDFRTPDPHAFLNQREALGVSTWDMFEQVLGAFGGRLEQVMAVGGDENLPKRERARQQRFKPVVFVKGPFNLEAGKSAAHTITINNYTGAVRVMLVAAGNTGTGSATQSMKVKNELMLLATAPRLARINDEMLIPVTVFTELKNTANITVKLRTEGMLQVIGEAQKVISAKGKGEQMVFFKVKAKSEGTGRMVCTAESGALLAKHEIEMSVENPFPRQYYVDQKLVEPGKSIVFKPDCPGSEGRKAWLEVSNLPDIGLSLRLAELLQYPYGCTEQVATQGLAMLYVPSLLKPGSEELKQYERAMNSAIRQLENRITAEGRIIYWPGPNYIHEWAEVFAAHFLIAANKENRYAGGSLLQRVIGVQERLAQGWSAWQAGPDEYLVQAYRLYMLSLAGKPVMNAMNRLRELPKLDASSARMLALAYAMAGQRQAARELGLGLNNRPEPTNQYSTINLGSPVRDRSLQILTLTVLGEEAMALNQLQQLANDTRNAGLNTQESAWLMLAWQQIASKNPLRGKASYQLSGKNNNQISLQQAIQRHNLDPAAQSIEVKNSGEQALLFTLTSSALGEETNTVATSKGLELQVQYTYPDGRQVTAAGIRQGETALMNVTVANLSGRKIEFLALQSIIPAGWEILNSQTPGNAMQSTASSEFTDVRDDRVINYFSIEPAMKRSFVHRISATYAGSYVYPGVFCQALYEPSVEASTGARRINVKRSGEP